VTGVVLSVVAVVALAYSVYGCYKTIKYRVTYRPYSSSGSSSGRTYYDSRTAVNVKPNSSSNRTKPASSTANKGASKAGDKSKGKELNEG